MKYSKNNPPLVCMQTQSTCYRGTGTMNVLGVLWHCTGANNPTLKRYVQPSDNAADRDKWLELLGVNTGRNDWNHIPMQAGLNAWIGKLADGTPTTVQTMPWDYRPWGCGSGGRGTCNDGWVQFEICEDALTDAEYFNAVYKEGCELTAYICQMYGLDPKGTVSHAGTTVPVILCHNDSAKLGLGTYHGDVYNWFNKYGKTMDDVRNDVAALLSGGSTETTPKPEPEVEYLTYGEKVNMVCNLAMSEVGNLEKLTNDQLYDKTANPGRGNFTKYAYEIDTLWPTFYNETVNGKDGCSSFVDWLFLHLFGYENAQKMLYYPEKSGGADCKESADYFRARGKFFTVPMKGDKVFFGDYGAEGHTGIVVKVEDNMIYTVENNVSVNGNPEGVWMKQYDLTETYIPGYGRPNYAVAIVKGETPEVPEEPEQPAAGDITEGATVKIKPGAVYYTGAAVANWILPIEWVVKSITGSRAVLGASADGAYTINSPIDVKYLSLVSEGNTPEIPEEPEVPEVSADDCTVTLSVLRSGSQGEQVKTLQQLLAAKGYQPGYADGIFGQNTGAAVKAFQGGHGITADGEVGNQTWSAILKGE